MNDKGGSAMPAAKAGESRVFQGPSRYIQGPGEINNLPKFAGSFGDTALAIIDTFFYAEYSKKLEEMFEAAGMTCYSYEFSGAATDDAIAKIAEFTRALPKTPQTFIGLGGGQTLDGLFLVRGFLAAVDVQEELPVRRPVEDFFVALGIAEFARNLFPDQFGGLGIIFDFADDLLHGFLPFALRSTHVRCAVRSDLITPGI